MQATRDPAAETFIASLFDGLLMDNFSMKAFAFTVTDGDFHETVDGERAFRGFLLKALEGLSPREYPQCLTAFIDAYPSVFLGAHALALWLLSFDEDNWFGFDGALQRTRAYLAAPGPLASRRELRLFKGLDPRGLLVDGCCPPDLPVVVDYGARLVTILTGALRD